MSGLTARRSALLLLGIPLAAACGILGVGDDGGGARDHATLVASIQFVGMVRIDPRNGAVMAQDAHRILQPTRVPAENTILGGVILSEPSVGYFSLSDFRTVWHEAATSLEAHWAGIADFSFSHTTASPNGREVVFFPARDDAGRPHIGIFEPVERVARVLHPGELHVRAMAVLHPGVVGASGAVVAFASREGNTLQDPADLWTIDAEDGRILDSIPEAELPPGSWRSERFWGYDDRHILVPGPQGLMVYDVFARQITRTLPLAGTFDGIVTDRSSGRFVLYDAGGPNYPGSGLLQIFDGAYERTVVDLAPEAADRPGQPPSVRGVAFGEDGLLYVMAGAKAAGVVQPVRLIVVDPESGEVVRVHTLSLDGNPSRGLFYVPRSR